jgi:translation elongation factor EF-4
MSDSTERKELNQSVVSHDEIPDHNNMDELVLEKHCFVIINYGAKQGQASELVMESFNMNKDKLDDLTSLVKHEVAWTANRQSYLQRIVSQKTGTLYALPQF